MSRGISKEQRAILEHMEDIYIIPSKDGNRDNDTEEKGNYTTFKDVAQMLWKYQHEHDSEWDSMGETEMKIVALKKVLGWSPSSTRHANSIYRRLYSLERRGHIASVEGSRPKVWVKISWDNETPYIELTSVCMGKIANYIAKNEGLIRIRTKDAIWQLDYSDLYNRSQEVFL